MMDELVSADGDPIVICSRLPSVSDLRALFDSDIREIHFVGELDDPDAVAFLNKFNKTCPKEGFTTIQLKMDDPTKNLL